MPDFYEEMELESITIRGGEDPELYTTRKNRNYPQFYASSIVVTFEHGNNSMFPWARVTLADGRTALVNITLCEEVVVLPTD
jgi:hypothetical protein